MTDLATSNADLAYLDAQFDNLPLSDDAQDLLFRAARTAYRFTDEAVSDDQVRAIYDLVKWGPTAMNSQPLRIVLVRSPEARARLVRHMSGNNQARTADAPLVAVLAVDHDFHNELHRTFPVAPGARDLFADESARTQTGHLNAGLQVGYFLVGVRAAGLAAGPMAGFDTDAVSRDFFPDGRHRAVLVVNLGHPAEDAYRPRQPRLDYADVVSTV